MSDAATVFQVGLFAGLGVTLALLVNYGKRFADTSEALAERS